MLSQMLHQFATVSVLSCGPSLGVSVGGDLSDIGWSELGVSSEAVAATVASAVFGPFSSLSPTEAEIAAADDAPACSRDADEVPGGVPGGVPDEYGVPAARSLCSSWLSALPWLWLPYLGQSTAYPCEYWRQNGWLV